MTPAPRLLVLDHRDSFVFVLADQFARLGCTVRSLRTSIASHALERELETYRPHLVLLSPGPGHPAQAGVVGTFLAAHPELPVLGVCLGHQALALAEGGRVERGGEPVHGKACGVAHDGDPLFEGLPPVFRAARYHSLTVTRVPPALEVIARGADDPDLVLALRHRHLPRIGVQFHPESVLTPLGGRIVHNALNFALQHQPQPQS